MTLVRSRNAPEASGRAVFRWLVNRAEISGEPGYEHYSVRAELCPMNGCRLSSVILSVVCILSLCLSLPSDSFAWELKIRSALFSFHYLYASQMGNQGFFGVYDVDMGSTGGDLASLNGWFRRRMVSGTTGVTSSVRLVLSPVLQVNEAVSVHGTYRVGPFRADNLGEWLGVYAGEFNSESWALASAGKWTRLWIEVNTPVGKIYYGKRFFRQGCGLQFGAGRIAEEVEETAHRTEEILELQAFTGPLTIGLGFYPWRRGSARYWNDEDHNAARVADIVGYARYAAGCVDMGAGGFYQTFNEGPEAERTREERAFAIPKTTTATEGWLYLKYSDGYLFFNAEADWYYRTIRRQGSQSGRILMGSRDETAESETSAGGTSPFAPSYIESWRYMLEFGLVPGPAKLSILLAHMPGPDRRHGILIDKQPYIQEPDKSAYGVFYPYCLLMAKVYNAGVNSFRDMSASDVVAALASYMLASNLEMHASLMRARRSCHGYSWGYIRPNPSAFGRINFRQRGSFTDPAPSIPDNDLGWEFDLGFRWNLLENWQLRCRGAYWQPGKWFNYACVDKSVPNWDKPSSVNNFGVQPNRTIDPIIGFELYLNAKF